jgi:hypothetical protein
VARQLVLPMLLALPALLALLELFQRRFAPCRLHLSVARQLFLFGRLSSKQLHFPHCR